MPGPRDQIFLGITIDDFIVFERLLLSVDSSRRGAGSAALVDKVRAAYTDVGLPWHPDKGFSNAAELWGAHVDGSGPGEAELDPVARWFCSAPTQRHPKLLQRPDSWKAPSR